MQRYIIDEEELELLKAYDGKYSKTDTGVLEKLDKNALIRLLVLKDRSNELYFKRNEAARDVIDIVARTVGIDPDKSGFWLYSPYEDETTPLSRRIEEYINRSGDKAKLKKKVQELEEENRVLRSLITGGAANA